MNIKENPRRFDLNRIQSRRESLSNFRDIAIVGALAAVAGVVALEAFEEDSVTDDQTAAKLLYEKSQKAGKLIEVEIINPDDPKSRVNVRRNPAIFSENVLTRVEPGEETYKGVLVSPIPGRERSDPNLWGPWLAIKVNGEYGFIHNSFIARTDGKPLNEGQEIYNVRSGESQSASLSK